MPAPSSKENVRLLETAGLLEATSLTPDDRELIDRLSAEEIASLIQVAKRLYPDDPAMVKAGSLRSGRMRIFLPL